MPLNDLIKQLEDLQKPGKSTKRTLQDSVRALDSAMRKTRPLTPLQVSLKALDKACEDKGIYLKTPIPDVEFDGGAGSGNFAHAGRPGQIGGSGLGGGTKFDTTAIRKARAEQKKIKSTHLINTPERVALRERVIKDLYGTGAKKKERKAYLIMGLPASGKSMVSDPIVEAQGAFLVDPDLAKEKLPEFDGGKNAGAVHEESGDISGEVFKTAVSNGDNIVFPLVGKGLDKLRNINKLLKQQGYSTHLVMMDINPETAAKRAIARFEHTGRFVDPAYVLNEVGMKPSNNYDILKKEGEFDDFAKYSNDVPKGEKPRRMD